MKTLTGRQSLLGLQVLAGARMSLHILADVICSRKQRAFLRRPAAVIACEHSQLKRDLGNKLRWGNHGHVFACVNGTSH